jgi:large subunit ribosomal protein L10
MALTLEEKQAIVADVAKVAETAFSAIAAEYRGLTVEALTQLRNDARKADVYVRVVKNTLARRALENTAFECMQDGLSGPMILAFSMRDPGAAARVIRDFVKQNDRLKVKLLAVGGKLLGPQDLEAMAKLPTYEEAISQLLSVMQGPVAKLARTFKEVPSKLARTLAAVRDAKQAA